MNPYHVVKHVLSLGRTVPIHKTLEVVKFLKFPHTAALISHNLDPLPYGDEVLRLVMFSHDSPGLRDLRRKIGAAIAELIANDPQAVAELHG